MPFNSKTVGFLVAVVVTGLITTGSAYATPVFFSNEASYQAAVGTAGIALSVESFETPFTDAPTATFTDFSATAGGGIPEILSLASILATDGARDIGTIDFGFGGTVMTFQFNNPINAFAIDIIDPLDFNNGSGLTLALSNNNGASQTMISGIQANNSVFFVGLVDTMQSFSTVTITSTLTGDGIQYDRLQSGVLSSTNPIPEPSTILLLGTGMAGLVGWRLRKTRQN